MKSAALLTACMMLLTASPAFAELKVMVSIKPIHSLVAGVMEGVGIPGLLMSGNNSPHTYALKPDDAAKLQEAQMVFWVGPDLEAFLAKPLESLVGSATVVSLVQTPDLNTLPIREGFGFATHIEEDADHELGTVDSHIWLDPQNAKRLTNQIALTLAAQDPANAKTYMANAEKMNANLDVLTQEIAAQVTPVKGKGFIVFHDAYQYFEKRFGLEASGAIAIHPESSPGAKSIADIQKRIADGKVTCVFAEPQFDNTLIAIVTEGTNVKTAVLDPEGAQLEPGPALYDIMIRNIAKSFRACLS
jgi:zinc transport system substrate-binding protein